MAARTLGMLITILEFGKKHGLKENPAQGVKKLPGEKRKRFLSLEEMEKLGTVIANAATEDSTALAAIRTLLLTGCRKNEILGLPWEWFDAKSRCIRFGDTKTGAQIRPVGAAAVAFINAQPKREDKDGEEIKWVFPAARGKGHFIGLPKVLERLCLKANLKDITLHTLRHSFAATAAELGFSELTMLALLDFDSHDGETSWDEMVNVLILVVRELSRYGMKTIEFRSSGGKGIHLFILWDSPQDAYSVREFLRQVLSAVGYRNGTGGVAKGEIEIFPKQDSVPVGGCGNQFILPFAGRSVPLDPILDYTPADRGDISFLEWPSSPSVPIVTPPVRAAIPAMQYGMEASKLQDMLNFIDPDSSYETWLKVGMALHFETDGSDEGFLLWDEWSLRGYSYQDEVTQQKWASFKTNSARSVTAKTIRYLARANGWLGDVQEELDTLMTDEVAGTKPPLLEAKNHSGIAKRLLETQFRVQGHTSLLRTNGNWYSHGGMCYEEKADEVIRASVRKYLDYAMKPGNDGLPVPFHPSMSQINGVVDALSTAALVEKMQPPVWLSEHQDTNPTDFVSLTNGILHIPTRSLISHTPDFFNLNTLPYAWEETGEPQEWLKFLNSIWPNDDESISTLQEIFGYLLTPDTSQQKMFLIKGPRRSGKGTIGRLLKELLGSANTCGPSLTSLASHFGLQPLIGKLVAIIPDARVGGRTDKQGIVERLLMVSGEDNVTVDRKHVDAWTGALSARFVMLTNEIPQLGDASGALASRFIVLSMHQSFLGKEDHGLQARLLAELPQIFRWALDGRDRLKARGHFIQPSSALDVVGSLEELNSPIKAFVAEMCELGTDCESDKDEVYEAWRRWCGTNGREHPGAKATFCENLLNAFTSVKPARPRRGAERPHIFQGIRLKSDILDMV